MTQSFILIFGPPAVGKHAVGVEIARQTGFKLVHNQLSIECALPLFEFGTPEYKDLVRTIRTITFSKAAKANLPGLIFTLVWDFSNPAARPMVSEWCQIFRDEGWRINFLELAASVEVRLERNADPVRIAAKPSKQDLVKSREWLLRNERDWTMTSGEDPQVVSLADGYLALNTERLSAQDAADRAVRHFII